MVWFVGMVAYLVGGLIGSIESIDATFCRRAYSLALTISRNGQRRTRFAWIGGFYSFSEIDE